MCKNPNIGDKEGRPNSRRVINKKVYIVYINYLYLYLYLYLNCKLKKIKHLWLSYSR